MHSVKSNKSCAALRARSIVNGDIFLTLNICTSRKAHLARLHAVPNYMMQQLFSHIIILCIVIERARSTLQYSVENIRCKYS